VKRSAGTALMAIAWLVLLLPGVHAQEVGLAVTPMNGDTVTAATLVEELVGTGVSTSNETYSDPSAFHAAGLFSGGTGIIGFESGVLLTSGDVVNVVGPNTSDSAGTDNAVAGDAELREGDGEEPLVLRGPVPEARRPDPGVDQNRRPRRADEEGITREPPGPAGEELGIKRAVGLPRLARNVGVELVVVAEEPDRVGYAVKLDRTDYHRTRAGAGSP